MQTKVGLGPSKSPVKSFRHLFCWIFIRPPLSHVFYSALRYYYLIQVLAHSASLGVSIISNVPWSRFYLGLLAGANKQCLSSQDIELEPGRTLLV